MTPIVDARQRPESSRNPPVSSLIVRTLGCIPYGVAWKAMRAFNEGRVADSADELWLLEHPSVFTLGRAASSKHLLSPGSIPVIQSDRGGQTTCTARVNWSPIFFAISVGPVPECADRRIPRASGDRYAGIGCDPSPAAARGPGGLCRREQDRGGGSAGEPELHFARSGDQRRCRSRALFSHRPLRISRSSGDPSCRYRNHVECR